MSQFREFGISAETAFLLGKEFTFQNCIDFVAQYGRYGDPVPIHVIEYSALEQANEKIKELKAKLDFVERELYRLATYKTDKEVGEYGQSYLAQQAREILEKIRGEDEV